MTVRRKEDVTLNPFDIGNNICQNICVYPQFPAKLRIKNDPSLSGVSLLLLLKDNVFVNFLSDRAENGFQQQNGLRWVTCVEAVCLVMFEAVCGFNNKLEFNNW